MGCCGNKSGCKSNAEPEQFKFPSHEILDTLQNVSSDFIVKLQEIAFAGVRAGRLFCGLDIKNVALAQLAKQISVLAVENAYLKTVLNLFSPMDIGVTDSTVEVRFGPSDSYKLTIPVTQKNSRREMAKQLRAVADKLETELDQKISNHDQTFLPFVVEHASK